MKVLLLRSESAFSVVEVMTAAVAGLVVVAAALQSVVYFQGQFVRRHEQITQRQDVRLGLELLGQELRLAGPGSLSVIRPDLVEFTANVGGLTTTVRAPVDPGQLTATVEDGRGWPDGKVVSMCWSDQCEHVTLARAGLRNLLTFVEPARRAIPSGACAAVMNRVRYYSRLDEHGRLRWLRQIDGGAGVIAADIVSFGLRYWDAQGRPALRSEWVRRVEVEITLPGGGVKETREFSLRG